MRQQGFAALLKGRGHMYVCVCVCVCVCVRYVRLQLEPPQAPRVSIHPLLYLSCVPNAVSSRSCRKPSKIGEGRQVRSGRFVSQKVEKHNQIKSAAPSLYTKQPSNYSPTEKSELHQTQKAPTNASTQVCVCRSPLI